MSVESPASSTEEVRSRPAAGYEDNRGDGWVSFAGIMLMIAGTINFIGGIAAIDNSSFYVGETRLIFDDLNTWGWIMLAIGAAQVLSAVGIWMRNNFATVLGVVFASLNATVQLLIISAFPLWALAIFAMDLLIIYGLISYGGKLDRA